MKCFSGSLLHVIPVAVVVGSLLALADSSRAQEPAPDAQTVQASPQPEAATSPAAAAAADSSASKDDAEDPDDDDAEDKPDSGPRAQAPDSTRDDVTGVSPQAQGFDGDAWGDDSSQLAAGPLTFRLALQTRYRETFTTPSGDTRPGIALREDVLAQDDDGFALQRFLLRMAVTPKPWITFKGTLDFAKLRGSDVNDVVKQAIATLRPMKKRLELYAGVFKIPYSILELDPVAEYELTDFGDTNELINDMGFAGRDVGLALMFAPLPKPKWARIIVGTWRGHAKDEHSSPLGVLAARIESKPWVKGFRVGASVVGMPFSQDYKQPFETSSKDVLPNPPDPLYPREQRWDSGKAYAADISYTRRRFSVRVEGLIGDRIDVDQRYGARSYAGVWALVAYRFKVGKIGIMPAGRVELMDADREHDSAGRRILSFGLNLLYKRSVRFVIDVSHTDVQDETAVIDQPTPLAYYPYLALDNTRVTGQLQLEL